MPRHIKWCVNPEDLYRLAVFASNDMGPLNHNADAAYLFGHNQCFERSILNAGVRLYREQNVPKIFLCKPAPGYPYIGAPGTPNYYSFEAWKKYLIAKRVHEEVIHPIVSPLPKSPEEKFPISNTATEAHLFVQYAKQEGWKHVYVVTQPGHILRAFALVVTFALRDYPELKIYAKAGSPYQSWTQEASLNQGIGTGTYFDGAMDAEFSRQNTLYDNEYDLCSAEEVMAYIRHRDQIT